MTDRTVSKIKQLAKSLIRRKQPVIIGDLQRLRPVSDTFGLDRGTPIDRYYIEKFINSQGDAILGDALEIGELLYIDKFDRHVETKNILAPVEEAVGNSENAADIIIGDLTDTTTLPGDRFDSFVCTQTLNFIYEVSAAVEGAHHLLKPGGQFVGTVSGISQISRYDMDRWGDYWRFTTASLERLLSDVFGNTCHVESFGNALSAQLFLQGVSVEDLPDTNILDEHDDDYQVLIGFTAGKG